MPDSLEPLDGRGSQAGSAERGAFDEFVAWRYGHLVRLTWVLTGDLASTGVVTSAFAAARHHWGEISVFDVPEAWVTGRTERVLDRPAWRRPVRSWTGQQPEDLRAATDDLVWAAVQALPRDEARRVASALLEGSGPAVDRIAAAVAEERGDLAVARARVRDAVASLRAVPIEVPDWDQVDRRRTRHAARLLGGATLVAAVVAGAVLTFAAPDEGSSPPIAGSVVGGADVPDRAPPSLDEAGESPELGSWLQVRAPFGVTGRAHAVASVADTVIAVGQAVDDAIRPAVWRSGDGGRSWTGGPVPEAIGAFVDVALDHRDFDGAPASGRGAMRAVALLAGPESQLWGSVDLVRWEPVFRPTGATVTAIVAGSAGYVAIGRSSGPESAWSWWSADGIVWERAQVPSQLAFVVHDLAVGPAGYLALGRAADRAVLLQSSDGRTWKPSGLEAEPAELAYVDGSESGFVAVGIGPESVFLDGRQWSPAATDDGAERPRRMVDVAGIPGSVVTIGELGGTNGLWVLLPEGWALVPRSDGAGLEGVSYDAEADRHVAVGRDVWIRDDGAPSEVPDLPDCGAVPTLGWCLVAPSFQDQRQGAAGVWTGTQMVMWGGADEDGVHDDGVVESVRDGTRRPIAASPLTARRDPVTVWTGDHMLVWGGDGGGEPLADGAAYDPVADYWEPMSAPPGASRSDGASLAATWTGVELVVVGVGAYDPSTDRWRAIAPPPIELTDGYPLAAVWTGSVVVVVGGTVDGTTTTAFAYEPDVDRWQALGSAPLDPHSVAIVWTGRDVVGVDYRNQAAAWTPGSGWSSLPAIPLPEAECSTRLVLVDALPMAAQCSGLAILGVAGWTPLAWPLPDDEAWPPGPSWVTATGDTLRAGRATLTVDPDGSVPPGARLVAGPLELTLAEGEHLVAATRDDGSFTFLVERPEGKRCTIRTLAPGAVPDDPLDARSTVTIRRVDGSNEIIGVVTAEPPPVAMTHVAWRHSEHVSFDVACPTTNDALTLAEQLTPY
jgi:hypothetical protein